MNRDFLVKGNWWRSTAKAALGSILTIGTASGLGCLNRPVEPIEPLTTSTIVERLTQTSVDKIDLLLAIDNSRSMSDKQAILELAVPDLIGGLFNPPCIDMNNNPLPSAQQPLSPYGANSDCPAGSKREFPPVLDIHVGIVTSSLGVDGANSCASAPNGDSYAVNPDNGCAAGQTNFTEDDQAHLISRQDPCNQAAGNFPTYQNLGFLAWDPASQLMPPGDTSIPTIEGELTNLVTGLGEVGCGFESQNESWYRFLVDPAPYQSIAIGTVGGSASVVTNGVDQALLAQRNDFLRSDSLLAIIVLTDENDASMKEYGQYFYVGQSADANDNPFYLPRATAVCQTDPTSPCCYSCGQKTPANCTVDPTCANPTLSATSDPVNLREWDSKRRFGIEFYYQPDRYVDGLTQTTVADNQGDIVPNPLFTATGANSVRDPSLVFIAEITGVPWQDIARQTNGVPDLINGVDPLDSTVHGGFKSYDELIVKDSNGKDFFDYDLGNYIDYSTSPATINYGVPLNPLMVESLVPRMGTNIETGQAYLTADPITMNAIAPAPGPGKSAGVAPGTVQANPINGHEWTVQDGADLQYACIFDLLTTSYRDCSKPQISCDCSDEPAPAGTNDNPLCAPNPNDATMPGAPSLQVRAKAYPGLKNLAILQGMQDQGIVASICAKQVTDKTQPDFGYRPAVGAIIERLKKALGGQCLPRTLTPDPATGEVSCLILEAQVSSAPGCKPGQIDGCSCNECKPPTSPVARAPVTADHEPAVAAAQADPDANPDWNCFCEIDQTAGADLTACQTDTSTVVVNASNQTVNGWCYVDATIVSTNMVEAEKITQNCPETEKRLIRFVGAGNPVNGSTLYITCSGN